MNVPGWVWIATIVGLLVLLAIDLVIVDRKPHEVTIAEAARWVVFYVACAAVFGLGIWMLAGGEYSAQFFTGYITEYSLSIDNLFVFVIIMSTFSVPAIHQHKVLLIGIVLALIMRGIFIALGSAVTSRFSWVFYLFGLFLIYTAWKLVNQRETQDEEFRENIALRVVRRLLPVTNSYRGARSLVREHGRLLFTPMFIVMVAIGTTDLLFALDSIPAIFGLTKEPFLVFTANAFALMGLRQLYFLIGGLLDRLVYLPIGLAVILGFIGLKLILEAMHDNRPPFIDEGVPLPTIGIGLSLLVIVGVLAVTAVASLLKIRHLHRRAAHQPD
jgi:TerC family integral membrane protein